jgi:hypothetical protein
VYRDGRWYMINVPEIDQLTQALHRGEIEVMARELIAVSTDQPIDTIAVRLTMKGSARRPGLLDSFRSVFYHPNR